jgi:hypothetical protein
MRFIMDSLSWNFGALRSRRLADDIRGAFLWRASAAIVSEIGEQFVHGFELGGVNHRTTFPPNADETGLPKPVEMERECVGCEVEGGRDTSRGHPFRPRLHEEAKDIEATVLSESGKRRDSIRFFHISTNIEI